MSAFKKLAFAVLHGAAFGLGLLILIVGALMSFGSFSFPGRSVETTEKQLRPTAAQLVITNTKEVDASANTDESRCGSMPSIYQRQFTGTIENTGPESDRYISVYADLFDKDGVFIYQCQTSFHEPLKTGEKQNFLIGCHGLPAATSEKYATFKIYAKGG
jgi:hypothetical protein